MKKVTELLRRMFKWRSQVPTRDKQRLNNVAVLLIQSKKYDFAAKAYDAAENPQMASFIRENFT